MRRCALRVCLVVVLILSGAGLVSAKLITLSYSGDPSEIRDLTWRVTCDGELLATFRLGAQPVTIDTSSRPGGSQECRVRFFAQEGSGRTRFDSSAGHFTNPDGSPNSNVGPCLHDPACTTHLDITITPAQIEGLENVRSGTGSPTRSRGDTPRSQKRDLGKDLASVTLQFLFLENARRRSERDAEQQFEDMMAAQREQALNDVLASVATEPEVDIPDRPDPKPDDEEDSQQLCVQVSDRQRNPVRQTEVVVTLPNVSAVLAKASTGADGGCCMMLPIEAGTRPTQQSSLVVVVSHPRFATELRLVDPSVTKAMRIELSRHDTSLAWSRRNQAAVSAISTALDSHVSLLFPQSSAEDLNSGYTPCGELRLGRCNQTYLGRVCQPNVAFKGKIVFGEFAGAAPEAVQSGTAKALTGACPFWFTQVPQHDNEIATPVHFGWNSDSPKPEYRYKLDMPGDWMGGLRYARAKWSDWGPLEEEKYEDFILDGRYSFVVEARLPGESLGTIESSFEMHFVMPEIFAQASDVDWEHARQIPSERARYTYLADQCEAAYVMWQRVFAGESRKLELTTSPEELWDVATGSITEHLALDKGIIPLLETAAHHGTASLLQRVFTAKSIYEIVKQVGVDFVLIYRRQSVNRAFFNAWVYSQCMREAQHALEGPRANQ